MTELRKGTKKYEYFMERSKAYRGDELSSVYKSFSSDKRNAELKIKRMMLDLDGYGYHICGKNCDTFSCSFQTKTHVYFFTSENTYVMEK